MIMSFALFYAGLCPLQTIIGFLYLLAESFFNTDQKEWVYVPNLIGLAILASTYLLNQYSKDYQTIISSWVSGSPFWIIVIQEHIVIVIAIVAYMVQSRQVKLELAVPVDDSERVKQLLNELKRLKSQP